MRAGRQNVIKFPENEFIDLVHCDFFLCQVLFSYIMILVNSLKSSMVWTCRNLLRLPLIA